MSRFLRFLAERHLEGNHNQLKESVIAVEVFGRKPDHDPSQDSIVRTEASRLRARLAEYYLGEGKDDEIVLESAQGRIHTRLSLTGRGVPTGATSKEDTPTRLAGHSSGSHPVGDRRNRLG